jgi:hypothetical protein
VKDKATDTKAWADARRWFMRANRADSSAPEPPIEFYDTFLAQGIEPTANAAAGLKAALSLAPEDWRLRFTVARQWLNEGKGKEARETLAIAAYGGHSAGASEFAATLIGAIDKDGAPGGLKAWTSAEEEVKKKTDGKPDKDGA